MGIKLRFAPPAALAVVLVTLPLTGVSFRGDERRNIYFNAERFGTNPLEPLSQAFSEIDVFLNQGNFRPLGRFLDYTEHVFVFEAAEASGVPPHIVQGMIRLGMLVLLALVARRLVTRLMASSGVDEASSYLPLALAACLVSAGTEHPIVHFPFLFITSALIVLGVCQWVVRDQDLETQRCSCFQLIAVGLVGALTASFFDMTYVAPPLALAYLVARAFAQAKTPGSTARTAAAKRVAALWVGFLAVFVPVRLMIAAECSDGRCYSGSDIEISSKVFGLLADRVITAFPVSGWRFNASQAEATGTFFGAKDALGNSLTALVLLGLAAVVFLAFRSRSSEVTSSKSAARPALALIAFGCSITLFSGLLVSFSRLLQREQFAIGEGWRDTLLAQTGWALVICGAAVLVSQKVGQVEWRLSVTRLALLVLLASSASLTLIANERAALTDRRDDLASITIQISSTTVNFDVSDESNAYRCHLLDRYTTFEPDPKAWIGGPQLSQTLNALTFSRYGRPYCEITG